MASVLGYSMIRDYFIFCLILLAVEYFIVSARVNAIAFRMQAKQFGQFKKILFTERIVKMFGTYIIFCIPLLGIFVVLYSVFCSDETFADAIFTPNSFDFDTGCSYNKDRHSLEKEIYKFG